MGKTVVKPFAEKAVQSGLSYAGDKLGKKAAEKSGDFIMKKKSWQVNSIDHQWELNFLHPQ